jgi:DNA-binding NarL/FixJ family response regulator
MIEDYKMEMKDEKNTESNSADADALTEDQNLSEEQYEITVGDIDSGDLDFDVADDEDEVGKDQKDKEQVSGEFTESDSDILDLDVLDFDLVDDSEDENADKLEKDDGNKNENLDYENDANALDDLPPLEESDLLNLDIEEPLDNVDFGETAQQDNFFDKFTEDELSPLNFAGKQIVIFYTNKEQAELLKRYLSDRTGMEVECIGKKENLWRYLKIDPLDLIILETGTEGNSDSMEIMQQTKDQFPEVHFICLSGPVSLERRLQFLNAGALDYLTRPLHLSTIAQSVLVQFSRADIDEDFADLDSEAYDIPEEEPIVDSTEDIPDKKSGSSAKRVDDGLDLADEIDLIDEDF